MSRSRAHVGDRWQSWHGLAEGAWKGVAAYSACWAEAEGISMQEGKGAEAPERFSVAGEPHRRHTETVSSGSDP
jgi:hypothetical protein